MYSLKLNRVLMLVFGAVLLVGLFSGGLAKTRNKPSPKKQVPATNPVPVEPAESDEASVDDAASEDEADFIKELGANVTTIQPTEEPIVTESPDAEQIKKLITEIMDKLIGSTTMKVTVGLILIVVIESLVIMVLSCLYCRAKGKQAYAAVPPSAEDAQAAYAAQAGQNHYSPPSQ